MSNNEAWLVLSFAIMVVAMLANLFQKIEKLERRLNCLDAGREPDDDAMSEDAASIGREAFQRRDHRG